MSFASQLKSMRMRKGKSLQELADEIGISKPHLWDLESGRAKNPTREVLEKISGFFRVPISTLLGEGEEGLNDSDDQRLRVMFRELRDLKPGDLELMEAMLQKLRETRKQRDS